MPTQTEIRTAITNKIVESLKQGRIPWRRPWTGVDGPRTPTNFVTNRRYSGMNIPILWLAGQERGYSVDFWATYQQWKSIGANVRKGEKATQIVFFRPIKKTVQKEDGSERLESFPLLRVIPVFSIHQVSGAAVEAIFDRPARPVFEHEQRAEFEKVVAATGAQVTYGGSKALYYRFPEDRIQLPPEEDFVSFPAFAETLAHELSHWSEWRLSWQGNYAEGELRAELSAVFTVAALNIPESNDLTNHASYIQSWLEALQNDPKYVFRAAAAASKATDYILSFSRPQSENQTDDATAAVA